MAEQDDEYTSQPLFDQIDPWSRNLKAEFYKFLADDPIVGNTGESGPSTLMDGFYDRAVHERPILSFVVSRLGQSTLELVLRDAEIAANKPVTPLDLPDFILKSLKRVRPGGEWNTSEKLREVRKGLVADGLLARTDYPIIAGAFQVSEILALDGHEDYALDTIAATAKWLQLVERKKSQASDRTGDPAA